LSDNFSAEENIEFEQRGWAPEKAIKRAAREAKKPRPVYEEFTVHSNIEETK